MNTKRTQTTIAVLLAAFVAGPVLAEEAAPAPAPAPAPATISSRRPAPGALNMPSGPRFDSLSPEEKEHIRRMAEFKAARDAAERDLLRLDDEAQDRKAAIREENEEAKALYDRIQELRAEFVSATNALEKIYREDEALKAIVGRIEPARKIVEDSQRSMNKEVVAAMHKRMSAQREAYEKDHPAPTTPEARAAAAGMTVEDFTNLMERARPAGAPVSPIPSAPQLLGRLPGHPGAPTPPSAPAPAPSGDKDPSAK